MVKRSSASDKTTLDLSRKVSLLCDGVEQRTNPFAYHAWFRIVRCIHPSAVTSNTNTSYGTCVIDWMTYAKKTKKIFLKMCHTFRRTLEDWDSKLKWLWKPFLQPQKLTSGACHRTYPLGSCCMSEIAVRQSSLHRYKLEALLSTSTVFLCSTLKLRSMHIRPEGFYCKPIYS